jgi:hypothetical protein
MNAKGGGVVHGEFSSRRPRRNGISQKVKSILLRGDNRRPDSFPAIPPFTPSSVLAAAKVLAIHNNKNTDIPVRR